jgi:hypothetical protein
MSPLRPHAPATRDAALQRRRRLLLGAGAGGLTAVGVLTGVLAGSAANAASTGTGGAATGTGSTTQPGDSQSGTQPGSPSQGTLNPPQAPPGGFAGGGAPHAVTGGSGH